MLPVASVCAHGIWPPVLAPPRLYVPAVAPGSGRRPRAGGLPDRRLASRFLASLVSPSGTPATRTLEPAMANPFESVRVLWSATDEQFFRITPEIFPPSFLRGASALLASNDLAEGDA